MQEQYGPARAPLVSDEARRPRSSVVAILLGGLVVDVIGSMLLTAALASAIAILLVGDGAATVRSLTGSPVYMAVAAGGDSLLVVAGGYTAAWWARRRPLAHALGAGCLSFGAAFAGFWMEGEARTFWINVALLALHLPFALLGGHLFARSQPV